VGVRQVIAGSYTSSLGGTNLEYTRKGWSIHLTTFGEDVDETDAYGKTLVEQIYTGANIEIEAVLRVYQAAALTAFWPWTGTFGLVSSSTFPIGRRATDVATAIGALVLTAVTGTPAAGGGTITTATAALPLLAPGFDVNLLLSSQPRDIPLRFRCYPPITQPSDQNLAKMTIT